VFYFIEGRPASNSIREPLYLCDSNEDNPSDHGFFLRAVRWGTITYGSRIAFDLLIGLALAALLVSTYSVQALGNWVGDLPYWQAAALMIVIAIPLYVCSIPGIIVGATLVLGGFTPAMVWIFLMAGPVTNLGDINVLRRNLGWRSTSLYVGVVVVVTFLWGWVVHANLQWTDLYAHVREYYGTQSGLVGFDGDISAAVADSNWLGIPREIYFASALMMVFFTLNGAWLALKQFCVNPCLHCKQFQQDLSLNPAICRQPCWKSWLLRTVRLNFVLRGKKLKVRRKAIHAEQMEKVEQD
jgi:hypothetical protein